MRSRANIQEELSLYSWQEQITNNLLEGKSFTALLPRGGGKGIAYLSAAADLDGISIIVCDSSARLERRLEQAKQLDQVVHAWSNAEEAPESQGILFILKQQLEEQVDSLVEKLGEKFKRLIVDGAESQSEAPAWFHKLPSSISKALFPQSHSNEAWWSHEEFVSHTPLLTIEDELGEFTIADADGSIKELLTDKMKNQEGEVLLFSIKIEDQLHDDEAIELADLKEPANADKTGVVFFLQPDSDIPLGKKHFKTAIYQSLPSSLKQLAHVLRNGSEEVIFHSPSDEGHSEDTAASHSRKLQDFLTKQSAQSQQPSLYLGTSELLQGMGLPITPQPSYDRSTQQLEEALVELKESGFILSQEEVFFNVKIYNVRKWKEALLQSNPDLLAFWKAYDQMHQKLPALQSLQLKLLPGRLMALKSLSLHLPYSLSELCDLFKKLDQEGVMGLELQHAPSAHPGESEYQITVKAVTPPSTSVIYWSNSAAQRNTLLREALSTKAFKQSTELTALWNQEAKQAQTWLKLWALISETEKENALVQLAGRILSRLEIEKTAAGLLAWEFVSAKLEIPGISPVKMSDLLPPKQDFTEQLLDCFMFLLEAREGKKRTLLADAALSFPPEHLSEELALAFLKNNTSKIMQLNNAQSQQTLVESFNGFALQHAASEKRSEWSQAAGWVAHLLGDSKKAYEWMLQEVPTNGIGLWRFAEIASKAEQAEKGLEILNKHEDQFPVAKGRIGALRKELDQKLAHSIHSQAKDLNAETLRSYLEGNPSSIPPKVEKAVLKQLADREEATLEELKKIATWVERDGDWKRSEQYRKQIYAQQPENAENLNGLAKIALRQKNIAEGLKLAVEATRNDPRKYPVEPLLSDFQSLLFNDLELLREALIELPAHPALSELEKELTHRSKIEKELKPLLEKAEKELALGKFASALEIAHDAIEKEKKLASPRFHTIIRTVNNKGRELQHALRKRLPRDPKKRNRMLEELSQAAEGYGFKNLAEEALQRLIKLNPQYGKGFVKLARKSNDPSQKNEAYKTAISLAKSPEQRQHNIEEYGKFLVDQKQGDELVPLLLDLLKQFPKEEHIFEDFLLRILKRVDDQKMNQQIDKFIEESDDKNQLRKIRKELEKYEVLDPWKRALLSIKTDKPEPKKRKKKKSKAAS